MPRNEANGSPVGALQAARAFIAAWQDEAEARGRRRLLASDLLNYVEVYPSPARLIVDDHLVYQNESGEFVVEKCNVLCPPSVPAPEGAQS
jgi:hypothetical protein